MKGTLYIFAYPEQYMTNFIMIDWLLKLRKRNMKDINSHRISKELKTMLLNCNTFI